MKLERIQEKISQLKELRKWEVLCWLDLMLEKAQINDEKRSLEILENIIRKLPLAIILSLKGGIIHNRCVIILVSVRNKQAKRIAEGISTRHPFNRDFRVTKLLQSLVNDEKNSIYISDPKENELVEKQRELIKRENITAIYFVKAKTLLGNIVIAMDATGAKEEFSQDERDFLDTISRFLGRIETERERLKMGMDKIARETRINTLGFFVAAISHLFRNGIMTIGGLCNRIEIDVKNGDTERLKMKSGIINREAKKISAILQSLAELSHNLSQLETLRLQEYPIGLFMKFISDNLNGISINNYCEVCANSLFKTDQRKLEKAVVAIINNLRQTDLPITIDVYREKTTFSIKISQCGGDFQKLQNMQLLAKTYEIEALSVLSAEDLNLSAYLIVLPQICKDFQIVAGSNYLILRFDLIP